MPKKRRSLPPFLDECIVRQGGAATKANILFERYLNFVENEGLQAVKRTQFGNRLKKEFAKKRGKDGVRYLGVRLRGENEGED